MEPLNNVLTVNVGSSSIRFAFFASGDASKCLMSGQVERVGRPGTILQFRAGGEET